MPVSVKFKDQVNFSHQHGLGQTINTANVAGKTYFTIQLIAAQIIISLETTSTKYFAND